MPLWGTILLDVNVNPVFEIGFSNNKSDTLIHLAHWQYWWWFWFSFLWSLYFLMMFRVVKSKTLKFKPKIATSYRPHGKWGDVIVCVIPVSWCANIISNSNLLLRMIEWQAESSLFTVRVRGKQWYWVYKFDLRAVSDVLCAPKNIGHNKWIIYTPTSMEVADSYLHALQLRDQNKWVHNLWSKGLVTNIKFEDYNFFKNNEILNSTRQLFNKNTFKVYNITDLTVDKNFKIKEDLFAFSKFQIDKTMLLNYQTNSKVYSLDFIRTSNLDYSSYFLNVFENKYNSVGEEFFSSRWLKSNSTIHDQIRLIKFPVSNKIELEAGSNFNLFRFRFFEFDTYAEDKNLPHNSSLTIKQKRYKRRKLINPRVKFYKDNNGELTKNIKYIGSLGLINSTFLDKSKINQTLQYNDFKKLKIKNETSSVALSKRMLRTKRTLILPAHVGITAITNSYDVVHSWFIPGLGLKMDCIPGRSTHHTFFIENAGFYYGQCAEVCGRFHHHMPIRICALPFEQFLLWWHNFGLPKLVNTQNNKFSSNYYSFRKYIW